MDFLERSFEPSRAFANALDFLLQLDAWFDERGAAAISARSVAAGSTG